MALRRRNKVETSFSMASMTDIIFLLLLFFVISSTMSIPNDIKVNLPQSDSKSATKPIVTRVSIDKEGTYFVAKANERAVKIEADALEDYILSVVKQDSGSYLALYADENVMYKDVVRVLDVASSNKLKLVIATSPKSKKY